MGRKTSDLPLAGTVLRLAASADIFYSLHRGMQCGPTNVVCIIWFGHEAQCNAAAIACGGIFVSWFFGRTQARDTYSFSCYLIMEWRKGLFSHSFFFLPFFLSWSRGCSLHPSPRFFPSIFNEVGAALLKLAGGSFGHTSAGNFTGVARSEIHDPFGEGSLPFRPPGRGGSCKGMLKNPVNHPSWS